MDKYLYQNRLKRLMFLFFCGFLSGCIYFNLLWRILGPIFQNEWGQLFDHMMKYSVIDMHNWLRSKEIYIMPFCCMIIILGLTRIGGILVEGIVLNIGFLTGATQALLILCFNISEAVSFLIKITGAFSVHGIILGGCFVCVDSMSFLKRKLWDKNKKWKYIQMKKYFMFAFLTLSAYMVYILIINYVNNFGASFGKKFMI